MSGLRLVRAVLDTSTAEHEAAHVVVGLALGLRLRRATIVPSPWGSRKVALGYAWFGGSSREGFARTIMYCAGIAWESRPGGTPAAARADEIQARQFFTSQHDLACGVRIAREMLDGRRRAHARIASELCDRDLTSADIEAMLFEC